MKTIGARLVGSAFLNGIFDNVARKAEGPRIRAFGGLPTIAGGHRNLLPPRMVPPNNGGHRWQYPPTPQRSVTENHFGENITDHFRWLEDGTSAEVQGWSRRQDQFARGHLQTRLHSAQLLTRFNAILFTDYESIPTVYGGREFFYRKRKDQEHAVLYSRPVSGGNEKVLLDPNTWKDTTLGLVSISPNGKYLAFGRHVSNMDESTLSVLDIDTGKILQNETNQYAKDHDCVWLPDSSGFFYYFYDRTGEEEYGVVLHKLGQDRSQDTRYFNGYAGIEISGDGRWFLADIHKTYARNEVYLLDRNNPDGKYFPLFKGDGKAQCFFYGDHVYMVRNDGSPFGRLERRALNNLKSNDWETVLPEQKGSVLVDVDFCHDKLVVTRRENLYSKISVHELDGTFIKDIELPYPAVATVYGSQNRGEFHVDYSSLSHPSVTERISLITGAREVFRDESDLLKSADYIEEQKWYTSKDGTRVPISVIRKKDVMLDGAAHLLMYGYGGFNLSMLPAFSKTMIPWLESGGIYAVAHIRGGSEIGADWHRQGMLENKQNVFDDFIAGAEFLVGQGYTNPKRLAIWGGSNGGLLTGAVMMQRPELFGAVISSVPLLDMLRFHQTMSGPSWIKEYGNPEKKEDFRVIRPYSPYHNVLTNGRYPATLFLSADSDDRVDPMHARKLAALLQARNQSDHPILLRVEEHAGHGGSSSLRARVQKQADAFAFLMDELGVEPGHGSV